jgi:hypothetical protein
MLGNGPEPTSINLDGRGCGQAEADAQVMQSTSTRWGKAELRSMTKLCCRVGQGPSAPALGKWYLTLAGEILNIGRASQTAQYGSIPDPYHERKDRYIACMRGFGSSLESGVLALASCADFSIEVFSW